MKIGEIEQQDYVPINREGMTDEEWGVKVVRRREELQQDSGIFYTTKDVLEHLRLLKPE
jgi:hypothetical protein